MKTILFIILALIISIKAQPTIDQQIRNIKNAPPEKRVELMNAFKQKLFLMNQNDRQKTIGKLKVKINANKSQIIPKVNNLIKNTSTIQININSNTVLQQRNIILKEHIPALPIITPNINNPIEQKDTLYDCK